MKEGNVWQALLKWINSINVTDFWRFRAWINLQVFRSFWLWVQLLDHSALYWGGIRFESLSTHHYWALSKSFIPSLVVWSVTKNTYLAEKRKIKRATVSSRAFVTLSKSLWNHSFKPIIAWPLGCKYGTIAWGDSIRKGADLEKQNCLFGVFPAKLGKCPFTLKTI